MSKILAIKNLRGVRGVRGATTVGQNSKEEIIAATQELLEKILNLNQMELDDIASCFFTVTGDLNAEFPALAARNLGWKNTALLCAKEIEVPDSLSACIRVLIHWNSDKTQAEIKHVYLKDAVKLRQDLSL